MNLILYVCQSNQHYLELDYGITSLLQIICHQAHEVWTNHSSVTWTLSVHSELYI